MKYTDKLGLPIWNKPETDVFDIEQFNEGMKAVDDIVIDILNKIDKLVIGDTQIDLDEYVKKEILKEYYKIIANKADKEEIEEISSQLDTKANENELIVERKRIDSFTSLAQGSTTGDAELIDGRVGTDGVTYSNLGTAIRTQIKNINNNFEIKANLFDKVKVSLGYLNKGEVVLDDNFFTSDFIEVNKGDVIKFSKNTNVDLFNSGKKYQVTSSSATTLTIPETTKYIRCSVYNQTAIDTYMVCKNNLPSSYLPYGEVLFYVKGNRIAKYNDLEKNNNGSNVLSNVKMTSFGDSITYMNRWQPTVSNITGMVSTVCGVGGTRVAKRSDVDESNNNNSMCADNRVNTIPTDTEILIFMGGMNDWAQSVPIGDIDRFNVDEYTYCGALVSMWKKIFTRCPNLKACYCLGVSTGYQPTTFVESYGWKNNQGLYTWDYGNASMKVAQYFGVRTIDITGVGINSITIGTKTDDGIHPTIATGVEMGKLVGNRIYNDFNK